MKEINSTIKPLRIELEMFEANTIVQTEYDYSKLKRGRNLISNVKNYGHQLCTQSYKYQVI